MNQEPGQGVAIRMLNPHEAGSCDQELIADSLLFSAAFRVFASRFGHVAWRAWLFAHRLFLFSLPFCLAVAALHLLNAVPAAFAQSESTGQAEVALQGYYLGGNGQPLINTSGVAVDFRQILPGMGLLTGSTEGYGSNGFRTGNMFVALDGAPMFGWHWNLRGGDFQFPFSQVENPFLNIYTPEVAARGFRVMMKRTNSNYQFFVGEETLLGGPRIPFRMIMPQRVLGGSYWHRIGERWEFGVRYLNLSTHPSALVDYSNYFFAGHDYRTSNSATFQSTYHVTKHLRFYTQASYGKATAFAGSTSGGKTTTQVPLSFLVGPSWDTDRFTVKANYIRESTTFLPLLGYFVGDRKGPYAEGRYRVTKNLEFYGSGSRYSNNLEKNPNVPSFESSGYTGGSSFLLPWKVSGSASLSTLDYTQRQSWRSGETASNNRQLNVNLNRPVRRHSLRLSLIDMSLNTNRVPQTQRFAELEDMFSWRRLVIGGALREQNAQTTDSRNSLFYRGSLQVNLKRLSAYGYVEKGNDLVNRSVFTTNAYSSSVVGMSAPLFKGWNFQVEAFRNNLLTDLNPQNIFLLGNAGLGLNTELSAFNQWSVYFRISKHFQWGKALPGGLSMGEYAARRAPLVGSVQGLVLEQAARGTRPAANVGVSLDDGRTAVTDAAGHYVFFEVPEGPHHVSLNMDQLPTEYEPGSVSKGDVRVEPRSIARADLNVVRLVMFSGRIVAPAAANIENVIIRLAGTGRYTTPYQDGGFSFYNLRDGEYDVAIDTRTLPEGYLLASPATVHVSTRGLSVIPPVLFELQRKPDPIKPVRQVLQQQIHVGGQNGAARNGTRQGLGNNGIRNGSGKGKGSARVGQSGASHTATVGGAS